MTSNIGSQEFTEEISHIGFDVEDEGKDRDKPKIVRDFAEKKSRVMGHLNKHFRPEFINRIDDVIVFNALDKDMLNGIVDILLEEISVVLKAKHIKLNFSKELKTYLIKVGYDPIYGARPLKRAITKYVTNELSTRLLSGEIVEGNEVNLDMKGDELIVKTIK